MLIHFDYVDPNGGRHTRFVGDGIILKSTTRRHLVEVTSSLSNDLGLGDHVWIPKQHISPRTSPEQHSASTPSQG